MKIVLCGSGSFLKEMDDLKRTLEKWGHRVVMPVHLDRKAREKVRPTYIKIKKTIGLRHFQEIARPSTDAILVANYAKNGIEGYIGANTFAEIALAWYFHKKIYILHPPTQDYLKDELETWEPKILDGKLEALR